MATPSPKEIFQASDMLSAARPLVSRAHEAACHCDDVLARDLRDRAAKALDAVEAKLNTATAAARAFYATDDVIIRQLATGRDMLSKIDAILAQCTPQAKRTFQKAGSFGKSKDRQSAQAGKNGIAFVFDLEDTPACKNLCLVSTYYVVRDATGEVLKKPSDGYVDGFDNLYGGTLPDSDAADGVIIDTPRFKFENDENGRLIQKENTSPCMPSSRSTAKGFRAKDAPNFLKPGFTAYFETCLVCLDARPDFTIHGAVRWIYRPGPPAVSELVTDAGKPDRTAASDGFVKALERFLANHP